jgi:hypothetical protein
MAGGSGPENPVDKILKEEQIVLDRWKQSGNCCCVFAQLSLD